MSSGALTLELRTSKREELVDITSELNRMAETRGWTHGAVLVYCPHTTAAVTVNEGADPDVARDMASFLTRLIPQNSGFRHAEGNSDAHIKASLVGPDQFIILDAGHLKLGTWQRVFFCEFDGPRSRKLWVRFLPA